MLRQLFYEYPPIRTVVNLTGGKGAGLHRVVWSLRPPPNVDGEADGAAVANDRGVGVRQMELPSVCLKRGTRYVGGTLFVLLLGIFLYKALCLRAFYLQAVIDLGGQPIPTLIDALDDRSEAVRAVVVEGLARYGRDSLPALLEAVRDKNPARREGAVIALNVMALKKSDVLPGLQEEAAPVFKELLNDPDDRVKARALTALWHVNKNPSEVLGPAICFLTIRDHRVQYEACMVLREIGPEARAAIPVLREMLGDHDDYIRTIAKDALEGIETQ